MSPKHTYTIMSMMKDEGHSLVEWVAYHTHIGFDNICVYTNNCSDGTDDMLIRLEEMGWVKHFRNDVPEGKKPQPNALTLGTTNKHVTDTEWLLVMDADEFLSIKTGRGRIGDLVGWMEEHEPEASAMAITWRFFGSSDVTDWNPGLVIENYTKAAPDKFKKGWGVKTLFKPYEEMKLGIHRPHIKKAKQEPANAKRMFDQIWLNGSGKRMPDEFSLSGWRSTKPTLGYRLVELNHYAVKSYEAYLLRRVRGNVNNKEDKYNAAYFALFDRNEIEETNALRHAKGTKKKMAQILSDPVMRKLQDDALAFHADRVRKLRDSGEYDHWLGELKEASQIPIDRIDEILFIQHLPKQWQDKVKEMQAAGVPDKTIAKMISQTQTAKKGETRKELLEAAGERPEDTLDEHSLKSKTADAASLDDNPFMDTPEAQALGVPLMQDRTRKMMVAARAAGGPDIDAAKAGTDGADKADGAPTPAIEDAPVKAKVDLRHPAPPIADILDEVTLGVSDRIDSGMGGAPAAPAPPTTPPPAKPAKSPKIAKAAKPAPSRARATSATTRKSSKTAAKSAGKGQ